MENIKKDVINLQNKITTLQEAKRKLIEISYPELTGEQEDNVISGSEFVNAYQNIIL